MQVIVVWNGTAVVVVGFGMAPVVVGIWVPNRVCNDGAAPVTTIDNN